VRAKSDRESWTLVLSALVRTWVRFAVPTRNKEIVQRYLELKDEMRKGREKNYQCS